LLLLLFFQAHFATLFFEKKSCFSQHRRQPKRLDQHRRNLHRKQAGQRHLNRAKREDVSETKEIRKHWIVVVVVFPSSFCDFVL
jgi:hypothetical protein